MKKLFILLMPIFLLFSCDNNSKSQNDTINSNSQLLFKKEIDTRTFLHIYKINTTSSDETFHNGYIFELYNEYFTVRNEQQINYYSTNFYGFKLIVK